MTGGNADTGLHVDVSAAFSADGTETFTVDADVAVEPAETLVILGPSGSGKTLLLETVAGFHDHVGVVTVDDRDVSDDPPESRDFGFVFQDYALFPHVTARENVEYGTRYHEDTRDAESLLAELGVGDLADRYPPTLSGGEKQRVALARALAVRPRVLLLDEPLSALDVPTRRDLRDDLADVLDGVTAVYVTHNRTTARALGDRIAVMRDGRVVQVGPPDDVFERPVSPFVARFTGANAIDLSAAPSLADRFDRGESDDGVGSVDDPVTVDGHGTDDGHGTVDGHVAIRPEAVGVAATEGDVHPAGGDGHAADIDVRATVERVVREDATSRVTLSFDGVEVDAFVDRPPGPGEEVQVTFPKGQLHRC